MVPKKQLSGYKKHKERKNDDKKVSFKFFSVPKND